MAQKLIPWNTGGGNIIVNYSGSGNDTVTVGSDTDNPSFNPRSQNITVHTTAGDSISRTVTVTQAGKVVPVGTIYNFAYTGTVREVTLSAGTYKIQCWGAQGGSNAIDSTYGITAQAGGKGGYSEGILTLDEVTTLYVFVGGQGSSSGNGGWNGGGGSRGSSDYTGTDYYLKSTYACGGGATDIALTTSTMSYSSYRTNRSSASLLSRSIVAGGGSGGAMGYKSTTSTGWETVGTIDLSQTSGTLNGYSWTRQQYKSGNNYYARANFVAGEDVFNAGDLIRITISSSFYNVQVFWTNGSTTSSILSSTSSNPVSFTWNSSPGSAYFARWQVRLSGAYYTDTVLVEKQVTTTTSENIGSNGYAGGGVEGVYSGSYYAATQNSAGGAGGFGYGANNYTSTIYGFCSGAAGSGWYGSGTGQSNAASAVVTEQGGGGSGFVNIAANAQYRPSGYTGLELDSGTTYAGNTSFPSPSGSTETGHTGNGYARITRVS